MSVFKTESRRVISVSKQKKKVVVFFPWKKKTEGIFLFHTVKQRGDLCFMFSSAKA